MFKCRCLRCGNLFETCADDVLRKDKRAVRSCGCLQIEAASKVGKLTGPIFIWKALENHYKKWESPKGNVYINWKNMMSRCFYEKDKCYNSYGKSGIKVCELWLSYDNYYKWAIENGYFAHCRAHRLDNSKDYCPENVIFLSETSHNYVTQYMKNNHLMSMSKDEVYRILSGLG